MPAFGSGGNEREFGSSSPHPPSKGRLFVVVAVAAFFVCVAAVRPEVKGYVASSIIEYHPRGAKGGSAHAGLPQSEERLVAALREELLNPQHLVPAAASISATGVETEQARQLERYVREGLTVRRQEDGAEAAYVVSLAGADRLLPVAMIDELTHRLLAAHRSQTDPRQEERQQRQAARDSAEAAALRAADELRAWEQRWREFQTARANRPAPVRPAPAASPAPPVANREWAELSRFRDQLREKRLTLLVERTPAHPEVRDIELRLEELERQLAATPQFVESPQPRVNQSSAVPRSAIEASPESVQQAEDERRENALAAEGRNLRRSLEEAEEELATTAAALAKLAETPPTETYPRFQIVEDAKIVGVVGGQPRGLGLAAFAVGAALFGMVVVTATGPRRPAVFTSTEQIAETLNVPVIAGVATGDGPALPREDAGWRAARLASRGAHLVIAVFGGALLLGAATDPLTARLLFRSPLQAFALACERFLTL